MKHLPPFAFFVGLLFLSTSPGLSATNSASTNSAPVCRLELFWGALPSITTVNIKGSETELTFKYFSASRKIEKTIVPTREAWAKFWKALDELKVWEWQKRYDNRNVRDGLVWSLEIKRGDRSVRSGGQNGYPGLRFAHDGWSAAELSFQRIPGSRRRTHRPSAVEGVEQPALADVAQFLSAPT